MAGNVGGVGGSHGKGIEPADDHDPSTTFIDSCNFINKEGAFLGKDIKITTVLTQK